jgi:hypothetical protein
MPGESTAVEEPQVGKPVTEKPTEVKEPKGLKTVLYVSGIVFMLFGVWAFLPTYMFDSIFGFYGRMIDEAYSFTASPIETYVLRIGLVSFLIYGLFLFIAATNPLRYRAIVTFAIVLSGAYMVLVPLLGELSGVSFRWYALDAVPSLVMFVLLLAFREQATERASE